MGSGVRPEGPLEQFQRVTDKLARIAGMSCGAVLEQTFTAVAINIVIIINELWSYLRFVIIVSKQELQSYFRFVIVVTKQDLKFE